MRRGLALILVAGLLGVLALLAAAFATLASLERRSSAQRLLTTKAALLARSGVEDAVARLSAGQDGSYGGEDWDGDGALGALEAACEVQAPGTLNAQDGLVRLALRPSFFRRAAGGDPLLADVQGQKRGATGELRPREEFATKATDLNARIHINGGDLLSNSLLPEGPNGFLVRLLNNLDVLLTGANTLGTQVVSARPPGGFRRVEDLEPVLGAAKLSRVRPYLTVRAWVDAKTLKPQPVEGRPHRFLDVDQAHRDGSAPASLAGVPPSAVAPWSATLTETNAFEGAKSYPVSWEREFVYALRQLRPAPPTFEPRAPLALNEAAEPVLAAVLLGLKGTWLSSWDGAAGWEGGFGFNTLSAKGGYSYPSQSTEEAPWIRSRLDLGSSYGAPTRPWYGPAAYDPAASSGVAPGYGGKPLVACLPLGRLRDTTALTLEQARSVAREIRLRISQKGPFRTWAEFDAFVAALPRWEDLDGNGSADGAPYPVSALTGLTGTTVTYARRRYEREDLDSDGVLRREVFTPASGTWASAVVWKDLGAGVFASGDVQGLTFVQKDVIRAMANPNAALNDLNPDANRFKEVDKLDLLEHTTEFALVPGDLREVRTAGRVLSADARLLAERERGAVCEVTVRTTHTVQSDFQPFAPAGPAGAGYAAAGGAVLVTHPEPPGNAPADYDGQVGLGFVDAGGGPDETLRGSLFGSLDADATGDAHAADLRGPLAAPLATPAGTDHGHLFADGAFSEKDATLKFPFAGNLPEVDTTYTLWSSGGDPTALTSCAFYVGAWVKPAWNPEATPRPHALASLSPGQTTLVPGGIFSPVSGYDIQCVPNWGVPIYDIPFHPVGCWFVPARNNQRQSSMTVAYSHGYTTAQGRSWPSRSLLWGTTHSFFQADTVNRRGILNAAGAWTPASSPLPIQTKPVGRLEARRWTFLGLTAGAPGVSAPGSCSIHLGRVKGSTDATSFSNGFGLNQKPLVPFHADGTPNHLRFGEVAAGNTMNFPADATFAGVRAGGRLTGKLSSALPCGYFATVQGYQAWLSSASGPAALGRYYKEDGAAFTSGPLGTSRPAGLFWTEVPAELWFDESGDGWMGDAATGYQALNDRFGPGGTGGPDGRRDLRIALELHDDAGLLVRMEEPGPLPPLRSTSGPVRYRAVFVNDWDAATRLNHPLDVTPFLDDVTVTVLAPLGARVLEWSDAPESA